MVLDPRESAKFVSDNAQHVSICNENLTVMADRLKDQIEKNPFFWKTQWNHPLRPDVLDKYGVMFIFLVDNWNFCFWPDEGARDFGIDFDGKIIKRSWGMVACVKRAINENIPILDPLWQENASFEEVESIFRPASCCGIVPLLKERHAALNQFGRFVRNKLDGDICNLLRMERLYFNI